MNFLLAAAIFFCLLHSNTRADREEVITEEDFKAFEEALVEIQRQGRTITPSESKKGLSDRSKKVNARLFQQTLAKPRKRARQRSQLRRLGRFNRKKSVTNTPRKHFNFRKTRRKPVVLGLKRQWISGETVKKKNKIVTRLLQKAEDSDGVDERDIEKAVLQALREETKRPFTLPTSTLSTTTVTTTTQKTTTGLSMLKFTPPHRRGELFQRRGGSQRIAVVETTTAESTSTVSALEDLIAVLEQIEPVEFSEDFGPKEPSTTSTRKPTTTSTIESTTSTTSRITTKRSRPKGASFRIASTDTPIITSTSISADGPVPPTTPAFDEEAHLLSLEIESNFLETQDGPEASSLPASEEPTPPAPHPPGPPRAGFAPPGAVPPSDQVVEELNTADDADFLVVAKKINTGSIIYICI